METVDRAVAARVTRNREERREAVGARVAGSSRRVRESLDLGRITRSEAFAACRASVDRDVGEYVGPDTVDDLPGLAARAVAELPDDPLLRAGLLNGFWELTLASPLAARRGDPARAARGQLDTARAAEVARALGTGRDGAGEVSRVLGVGYPLQTLRRAAEAFPLTETAPSSGDEMWLQSLVLHHLVGTGELETAVGEVRTLPSGPQRAAGAESVVRAYYGHPLRLDPLPDLVVDLLRTTDFASASDHLDRIASYLLRTHADLAVELLERWAADSESGTDDGRRYHRAACLVAWCAGDHDLALRLARRDATPWGEWDERRINASADFVLGQLETDVEERVDRLLRSVYSAEGELFERRMTDAAALLLVAGEPLEAAALFVLTNTSLGEKAWWGEGPAGLDIRLNRIRRVDDDEKLALLKSLQAAGVPGDIRLEGLGFEDPLHPGRGSRLRFPRSLAVLRNAVTRGREDGRIRRGQLPLRVARSQDSAVSPRPIASGGERVT